MEDKHMFEPEKRPPMGSRDRFFDFIVPPTVDPMTGKPDGRFKGIAGASDPKKLAQLHACPGCGPAIKNAMLTKNVSLLPDGPLKEIMQKVRKREIARDLRIM